MLLSSCSSPSRTTSPRQEQPGKTQEIQQPKPFTANDYVELSEQYSGIQRLEYLLKAAIEFQSVSCPKSQVITSLIAPKLSGENRSEAYLIDAECAFSLEDYEQAERSLSEVTNSAAFMQRKIILQASLHNQHKQWWQAAQTLAQLPDEDGQISLQIWSLLDKLSLTELQLKSQKSTLLQPTLQLLLMQRLYATQPDKLQMAVQEWQARHSWHKLAQQLPDSLIHSLTTRIFRPGKMGVILPLSGKLENQGLAVKEGILAAYFNEQQRQSQTANPRPLPELVFIDSNNNNLLLTEQFAELDFVLGPLLKENIAKFSPYIQSPSLALNYVNESLEAGLVESSEHYFFSLSPEDEASQMARHLFESGLTKPLLIQAENQAAERMSQAFVRTWTNLGMNKVESITFNNNQNMRDRISALLDVADSKARIKEIESLLVKELHSFERNRRDADAVVIFANAPQTELINPIIESSISPFADILPVFASSRSYSTQKSLNSMRDLRNLRFIDMPWMLPDHDYDSLHKLYISLWPKHQDTNLRLFAMGYDAFNVIEHLKPLQQLPQYRFTGLTGEIYMDNQQQLRRILPWGQIRDDKVVKLSGN
ncbi:penicillin-binding protein activator [Paraneptunicella aestuarii]|uniref:penicillin-binding protein activator n=1 Tax=Paraneptunicella aestuarii TaxID=2831148 RepID=UPI001E614E6C|nr:penicillin-binding protein activator [Paraneptunicella aestuarii]UAA38424.1 penicillin-binding protein activator [Paraneptunicella aestuarii]